MEAVLKTTGPVMQVRSIADIEAIEAKSYDEMVSARNLYDLFRATTQICGGNKALTVMRSADPADVGLALTHAELLGAVTRAANMFRGLGVGPDGGVAAFLTPTLPELPALLIGAQVAGVAGSLNYLLNRDAIFDLLNAMRATVLVIPAPHLDRECWDKAQDAFDRVPGLKHVLVVGGREARDRATPLASLLDRHSETGLEFTPTDDRDTVCAMFHTGGTTGRPKLVQLTHGNQIHAAFGFGQVFAYDQNDTVINGFPFFHVGGTMTVGLAVLAAGGHIVAPSPYGLRPPEVIANYWNIVAAHRATVIGGVPTSIAAITDSWPKDGDVPPIRMAATGGAVCPAAVSKRFTDTTGIALLETYGMTETAAAIAFSPANGAPLPGSVGLRAPFSQTRIWRLDPDNPGPCDAGEAGVVQLRGPQVFPGYLDPTHNAGVLSDDGWLTTGDIGFLNDDQRLVLTGREKDLIVRSGHNIDPALIEDVANRFDGVAASAAVGMPDQYAGELPALFVVPVAGRRIDMDALGAFLSENIAERPAVPKSVLLLDTLPLTAVGKVFKPTLRDLAIREKLRLDLLEICGESATADVEISTDAQKNTCVDVQVAGARADAVTQLAAAMAPLPQIWSIAIAEEPVLLERTDGIAVLTLNRPDALNAMSQRMTRALKARLEEVAADPDIRAVIITGAGRAFSAGGDLIEFEQALQKGGPVLLEHLSFNLDCLQMVEDLPMPVIAAVNGVALAGGLELILCCDIVIAADTARIGDGHTRYGIVPAGGATVRLAERVSPSRASQLFFTACSFPAEDFAQWGLVNEVVTPDVLMDRARQIATEIRQRSPEANRRVKALQRAGRATDRADRLQAEIAGFAEHLNGNDLQTGLAAFRKKEPPDF